MEHFRKLGIGFSPPAIQVWPEKKLSVNLEKIQIVAMSVQIRFLPDDVVVVAEVGEPLLQVAARAGLSIPTGCLMGSCHACEVELEDGSTICSCISGVPPGQDQLTINLFVDPTW